MTIKETGFAAVNIMTNLPHMMVMTVKRKAKKKQAKKPAWLGWHFADETETLRFGYGRHQKTKPQTLRLGDL